MSQFKLKMKADPYDDTADREQIRKLLKNINPDSEVKFNGQQDSIDMFWEHKGRYFAVEVAHTALWEFGATPFSGSYYEIPLRKWKHMWNVLYSSEICTSTAGMYCLLSNDLTYTVIFNFRDLLGIDIDDPENTHTRKIHDNDCSMVKVPLNFVKRYKKIP